MNLNLLSSEEFNASFGLLLAEFRELKAEVKSLRAAQSDKKHTITEVAKMLGLERQAIYARIKKQPTDRNYLKSHTHKGKTIIMGYDLEEYLKRTETGGKYHEEKLMRVAN